MNSNSLFHQKEPSIEIVLKNFSSIIKKLTFIQDITRVYQYHDEPKFFQFAASLNESKKFTDGHTKYINAGGSSFFSDEEAFLKCLCEATERYSCSIYRKKDLKYSSFSHVKKTAVSPFEFVGMSALDREKHHDKRLNFTNETIFSWVEGVRMGDGAKILLPAQTIYHSYNYNKTEGVIQVPISTGAAGGGSLAAALVRGILEVVERDAFMISYENKTALEKVNLEEIKSDRIDAILESIDRYGLKLHVLNITSDLNIPVYLSIVEDRTGLGVPISLGLKASLDFEGAILGSIEEAFHTRGWLRMLYEDRGGEFKNVKAKTIHSIEERGIYWYSSNKRKHLDFWLNKKIGRKKRAEHKKFSMSHGQQLKYLLNILKKFQYEAYYKDVSLPQLKEVDYFVVKVLIPKLQPLYLDERYPCLHGSRIDGTLNSRVNNMRKNVKHYPHPFL